MLIRPIDQGRRLRRQLEDRARSTGLPLRICSSPLSIIEEIPGEIDTRGKAGSPVHIVECGQDLHQAIGQADLKALCVGTTTTLAAMQAGLAADSQASVSETSLELVERVIRDHRSGGGPYLYVRGSPVARDLVSLLGAEGVPVDEIVVYRQFPASLTVKRRTSFEAVPPACPCIQRCPPAVWQTKLPIWRLRSGLSLYQRAGGESLAGIARVSVRIAARPNGDVMQELILSCCRLE